MSSDTKDPSGAPPPYSGPAAPYPPVQGQTPYPPAQTPYPPAGQAPYPAAQQPYPVAQQPYPQTSATTVYAVQQQPQPVATTTVVVSGRGTCPNCRIGNLVEQFTCCGIVMAILFFPIGLLCCLLMRQRVCTNCHAVF